MSAPTNRSPLQLLIAVYGSDKKYVQNFEPFKAHCEHIASAASTQGEGRVRLPVHRVVVVQAADGEESPDNSNSGSSFHVLVQPAPTRVEDIDVLFLKMSTERVEARLSLRRWVEEVQAKQVARKRRPMVLVDALDASDSVKSRFPWQRCFLEELQIGSATQLCGASSDCEDGSATTASIEHLCGVAVGGENRGGLRPFVVKSDASNGPKFTHGMYVMAGTPAFTPEATSLHPPANAWAQAASTYLTECPTTQSLLVQEVVPSAAVVYKVYVLGPNYVFVKRLNNDAFLKSSAGVCGEVRERVWVFNSQDRTLFPPKLEEGGGEESDDVVWEQRILDASQPSSTDDAVADATPNATTRREIMSLLAAVVPYLQKPSVLGFGLFGMDLVALPVVEQPLPPPLHKVEGSIPSATSAIPQHHTTFALLDINYFPSFKGVPHAQEKLLQYIEHCVLRRNDSS
ncbi:Hypothetical protein, putative [Bodo saltans]|uniref:Uncharacterized protein n=1 Tax=Bodo saltans TaxID=75058 RepID=A0A0S4IWQ6_BODSA|nr:Hypothetical protein, putative [Bodo saltans]|eukprot:CUG31837.1 Hypothetical protein, putative [Bodo saltans]